MHAATMSKREASNYRMVGRPHFDICIFTRLHVQLLHPYSPTKFSLTSIVEHLAYLKLRMLVKVHMKSAVLSA